MDNTHTARGMLLLAVAFFCFQGVSTAGQEQVILGAEYQRFWNHFSRPTAILARSISPQTQAMFGSGAHSSSLVAVGSVGPARYTERLKGIVEINQIGQVMQQAVADKVNVIIVIGDGMGMGQMTLPLLMRRARNIPQATWFETILAHGVTGLVMTHMQDEVVADSAASGTALATGSRTAPRRIAMDANALPLESVLDRAEKNGFRTGLITDTRITHATPAVFYAHAADRSQEADIAAQLAARGDIEVMLGGGARYFIPQKTRVSDHPALTAIRTEAHKKSKRKDSRDLIAEMGKKGYTLVTTARQLQQLSLATDKVLGLFAGSGMNAAIDRDDETTGEPSIPEMTGKALTLLARGGSRYFLMVECGRIDWESHGNDAGALVKAMDEMDATLGVAWRAFKKDPAHTLLLFTADHGNGGFGFSYAYNADPSSGAARVKKKKIDYLSFERLRLLDRQDKSLYALVRTSQTPAELVHQVKKNTAYSITLDQAKAVITAKNKYW